MDVSFRDLDPAYVILESKSNCSEALEIDECKLNPTSSNTLEEESNGANSTEKVKSNSTTEETASDASDVAKEEK